ncbi:MAG: hypothetical protein IE909_12655, partial [Campylobacterales bacterium]|nr:hypothetical protein [Campylobacterales bacterium]
PYCIKGTLETFGMLADQYPLESSLLLQYRKIENFVVSSEIIEELEVSELEFRSWLKIIFHLVVNYKYENNGKKEDFNILKEIVKSLLNPREKFIIIQLFSYSNNICVLSDRGHNNLGSVFGPNEMCLEFNLTKHDFLRMYIINNDFEVMGGIVSNASEIIENLKSSGYKRAKREKIIIDKYMDDIKSLRSFNKRSISQCLKNFYCSTTNIDI